MQTDTHHRENILVLILANNTFFFHFIVYFRSQTNRIKSNLKQITLKQKEYSNTQNKQ